MKLSNKLLILSSCLCVLTACAFALSILMSASDKEPSGNTTQKDYTVEKHVTQAENNISDSVTKPQGSLFYLLKIHDGRICAYMMSDGQNKVLWNSMEVPPTLSVEDIQILEKGIYTKSFEEMCLYFESYAS